MVIRLCEQHHQIHILQVKYNTVILSICSFKIFTNRAMYLIVDLQGKYKRKYFLTMTNTEKTTDDSFDLVGEWVEE